MQEYQPIVSVITVVYNAVSSIEITLKSVLSQTYSNIEYIVIDGGSKDGTCDVIGKYRDRLAYYVSEPDKGIYDAMNKGIRVSHGKWMNFMNAGDEFYSSDTLERVISLGPFLPVVKVLYGNVALRFNNQPDIIKNLGNADENIVQFSLNHQSTIIDGDWMRTKLYDIKYRICADVNFFNETAKAAHKFQHIPVVISSYEASDGVSAVNQLQLFHEFIDISGTKKWSRKWIRGFVKVVFLSMLHHTPFGMGDKLLYAYVKMRVR